MFKRKPSPGEFALQKILESLQQDMFTKDPNTPEYAAMADQFAKLYPLQEDPSKTRVSKDTLVLAGANLIGIVLIVGHERANVVTSKAMSFVQKLH